MSKKIPISLVLLVIISAVIYLTLQYGDKWKCDNTETGFELTNHAVYYNARIDNDTECSLITIEIEEADLETFSDLGFGIAKDKNHVYDVNFKGYSIIKGVDVGSYFVLDRAYRKDINNVYWYEEIITAADPASFEVLGDGYAKDDNHVYYLGEVMEDEDPNSFDIP